MNNLINELQAQEDKLLFPKFDQEDAWKLGTALSAKAMSESFPMVIEIRKSTGLVYLAALSGSTPDQLDWAERKSALSLRMETSSRLFALKIAERNARPFETGWLNRDFALAGGSFPVRVRGVGVVAVVTVSGLSSDEDHDFVVGVLEDYLRLR